ncbi:formylglycine-generating enzyme required for sulfatase activity [Isoptericola sp. CG 20/1183]|uniref:Formylglycine-generating enzyme required for sulfatase activity n=1 Tax=Isoptericola halotolerans TaxID=300560 RepID=A0ABX5EG10_9MICO|nr:MULTISPECIES: formylglycine-generating enzyme family protein [Isoptericola]PRZ08343.1 formylglycine-generating enzyme required for sulfatase activity [Isoptericola halotolerans]PRZ09140.1 formylglycine-generating enzyme required for sulfatase activity [Isoptericola sp. CG 20/1183]
MRTAHGRMVAIPPGTFLMGSDDHYPDERPAHEHPVRAFWIDRFAVTNADFARFVADTAYVTVAERPLDQADLPGSSSAARSPGALVFTPTRGPVDLRDWRQWWRWQHGAQWRHPEGPGTSIEHRMDHPVVQVAYEDAQAYARWAGARLPTEAEHEYAARGGRAGQEPYAWGADPYPGGTLQANTWLGRFPYEHRGPHGATTTPVGTFPPNGFGLSDMIGNVWEWTGSVYTALHRVPGAARIGPEHRPGLLAAQESPAASATRRVLKGGSYLCSPDYCLRFRPAARSAQTEDTSATHIGFRCARSA